VSVTAAPRELAPIVGDINSLAPRNAMGLPLSWSPMEGERLHDDVAALRSAPVTELVRQVESVEAPTGRRYAAGALLALVGDPRIDPFRPAMLAVAGGSVRLGTAFADVERIAAGFRRQGVQAAWIRKECPDYMAELADFHIGRYLVANVEYRAFLLEVPDAAIPTSWLLGRYPAEKANHPVYSLPPEAVDRYCEWLSASTGRRFRLPTEAEWEYAAAGTERRAFPWGDEYRAGLCNTIEERLLTTTPVGMYAAGSAWSGAMDMAGNVEEYVADGYHPYPGGEVIEDDLYNLVGTEYRVARGGAFNRFHDMARSRRRHGGPLNLNFYAMGFRLAETPVLSADRGAMAVSSQICTIR
jgi:toxoflavin biosynthesis protein ToxD